MGKLAKIILVCIGCVAFSILFKYTNRSLYNKIENAVLRVESHGDSLNRYYTFRIFSKMGMRNAYGDVIIPAKKYKKIVKDEIHDRYFAYKQKGYDIDILDDKGEKIFNSHRVKLLGGPSSNYWYAYYDKDCAKPGVCDKDGFIVIHPDKYDSVFLHLTKPDQYWFRVKAGNRVGVCDTKGEEIIPPKKYNKIYRYGKFPDFWYMVFVGDKRGICNKTGKEIVKPLYSKVGHSQKDDGFYTKKSENSKWEHTGLYLTGKPKIKPKQTTAQKPTSSKKDSKSGRTSSRASTVSYKYDCPVCYGTGTTWGPWGPMNCTICNGKGYIENRVNVDFSDIPDNPSPSSHSSSSSSSAPSNQQRSSSAQRSETCPHCHGSGQCQTCLGRGWYYSPFNGNTISCPNCDRNQNGKCQWCHGTGMR